MGHTLALVVLAGAAGLIAYTLAVYPCLIYALARLGRPVQEDPDHLPTISVLVPVYNEEKVLPEKLQNCLELDYPADRLQIAFASDGSSDRSAELLRACRDPRVTVFDYAVNRGKAAVLNDTIPRLTGQIVVLSDASGILQPTVLRTIGPLFADPQVGCVGGIYHIFKQGRTHVDAAESSYNGFEMQLRLWEGMAWSALSGTGALCAIRRADYQPLPDRVINDDFLIPSRIALQGKRVIYDQRVHVFDRIFTSLGDVYRRRVRIAYGNWQQLAHLRPLLNPLRGYLAWVFYSHKLLRTALPFLLVALVITSYALSPWLCLGLVTALAGLLVMGLAGLVLDRHIQGYNPLGLVSLVFFNCMAVFIGTFKYLIGSTVRW